MKKAFTLIELLVVVAIIAILTSIVLAQFSIAKSKSRDTKRVADVAQIQLAIQLYFDRCNQYPSSTNSGVTSIVNISSNVGCPSGITLGTFLNQLPTPPSGNYGGTEYTAYRYHVHTLNGVNDNYYLSAKLENDGAIFDSSLSGNIPVGGPGGWSGLSSQFEVGRSQLYYTVGPK